MIHLHSQAVGLSVKTTSTYAAGSGDFCDRLERGHDVTTRRAARVAQYLSDNWRSDLVDWPSDIPRPPPTPGSPADIPRPPPTPDTPAAKTEDVA
ncbi:hypothetical protein [Ruegeria sp.]|uniref:hypothetical protein n=1 Tax=Ruegeria sp. TaxID=1879320 RepID=UPI003B590A27